MVIGLLTVVIAVAVAVLPGLLPDIAVIVVVSSVPTVMPEGTCTVSVNVADPFAFTVIEDVLNSTVQP